MSRSNIHFLSQHTPSQTTATISPTYRKMGEWQSKDAGFLNDSYDRMRLIQFMAATAMERVRFKEVYSKAKEIHHIAVDLNKKHRKEATRHKINLPLRLSNSSESYLQKLDRVSDQHFEIMYLEYMQQKLSEIVLQLKLYKLLGNSKELLALYSSTLRQILKVELAK